MNTTTFSLTPAQSAPTPTRGEGKDIAFKNELLVEIANSSLPSGEG